MNTQATLSYPPELALNLLRDMLRVRIMEERAAELYGEGKIRGFLHLYIGEEAVAVGALHALAADDAIVATYREHGHALIQGVSMRAIMAEMYGRQQGCSGGAAPCTCSMPAHASLVAMPSSAVGCHWRSAWHWPSRCGRARGSALASSARGRWPRVPFTSR